MKWINGNHPKTTKMTRISEYKQALVRMQSGKNEPIYKTDWWAGNRWLCGNAGANVITHYSWIEAP